MSYQAILSQETSRGSPDQPSPRGFYFLAHAGKECWNSWRRDYPTVWNSTANLWDRALRWTHTSGNLALSDFPPIDFTGFEFGDGADFSGQVFDVNWGMVKFDSAKFGDDAIFSSARFSAGVSFKGTQFGKNASFVSLTFNNELSRHKPNDWICFERASFGDKFQFLSPMCWPGVNFDDIPTLSFKNATFGNQAKVLLTQTNGLLRFIDFSRVSFGTDSDLSGSVFKRLVSFEGASFGENANFENSHFETAHFEDSRFLGWVGLAGLEFGWISFARAQFEGRAHFANRKFNEHANFSGAKFRKVPLFHGCTLHQDTDFDDESFPTIPEGTANAARGYRTLKLAMSTHQATREEQLFFRCEMREERAVLWRSGEVSKRMRSTLYWLYEKASDYGASVWRPMFALILTIAVFSCLYAISSNSAQIWSPNRTLDMQETARWISYSVVNSLPLGGLEEVSRDLRSQLFASAIPTWLPTLIVIQKIVSLLFLFLVGLALRNLFKLK